MSTKQYTLNELFHKLVTLKSLQTIRNKDLEKDTTEKFKGNVKYENAIELSNIIKSEGNLRNMEGKMNSSDLKVVENINKFNQPNKVFRRRLAVGKNAGKDNDFHKEDEDKSYLNVKYQKESDFLMKKSSSDNVFSHLQECELPQFSQMAKTTNNWNNGNNLSKIIQKCSGLLKTKSSKIIIDFTYFTYSYRG